MKIQRFTIMFDPDGKFSGTVACNALAGEYKDDGRSIMITQSDLTMVACQGAQSDKAQKAFDTMSREKGLTYKFGGDELLLRGENQLWKLKRIAAGSDVNPQ